MADEHTIKVAIDAKGAKQGGDAFDAAIDKINKALTNLDKTSDKVFSNLRSKMSGIDFSRIAADVGKLGTLRVDANLATNLRGLSNALASFKGPPSGAAAALSAFSRALSSVHNPTVNISQLAAFTAALKGFRAPSAQQTQNLGVFFTSLHGIRLPTNIDTIVQGLNRITAAAVAARQSLGSIGQARIGVPRGLLGGAGGGPGGGSGGGGGNLRRGQYGPRGNGPYDGIFSGNQRATGELRGFENVVNPGFQSASIIRAAVPALTAGEGLKGLYEEGARLTQFQHILENATTIPDNAIASHERLAGAMQFVTDISSKYGMNLEEMRLAFAKFTVSADASGFTLKQTKTMFEDAAVGLRSIGASAQTTQLIYRALDQVMQTGHFSMMQMHKEIGLQMPAIQLMADTLTRITGKKVTSAQVEDLSRKGKLGADLTPEFLKTIREHYASGLPTAINSPVSALERLKTAWTVTVDKMNAAGVWDAMGAQFNRLADMLKRPEMQDMFKSMALGIADALRKMGDAAQWVADHMDIVIPLFKTFMVLGAAEAIVRIGGAFGGLTTLVANLVGILPKATAALRAFGAANVAANVSGAVGAVAGGAVAAATPAARTAARLAAVSATYGAGGPGVAAAGATAISAVAVTQTTAQVGLLARAGALATSAFTGLVEVLAGIGAIIMTPIGIAVAAITSLVGMFYLGRNAVMNLGGSFATVGDVASLWWDKITGLFSSVGGFFGKVWDGMGAAASKIFDGIVAASEVFAQGVVHSIAFAVAFAHNAAENFTTVFGLLGDRTPMTMGDVEAEWGREIAKKKKDKADRDRQAAADKREDARADKPSSAFDDLKTNDNKPANGTPAKESHKKTQAEKDHDAYEKLDKQVSPFDKQLKDYAEGMRLVSIEEKTGKTSADELARARQGLKDRMMESMHVMDPVVKANRELRTAEADLSAMVKEGFISLDMKKQKLDALKESLNKVLDPMKAFNLEMDKKDREAALGPMARAQQAEVDKLNEARKKNFQNPLNADEENQVRGRVAQDQKIQRDAADKNTGLQVWANSFGDLYTELAKFEEKMADGLASAFGKFVKTGKVDFHELTMSMLADLSQLAFKQLERAVFENVLGLTGPRARGTDPTGLSPSGNGGLMGLLGIGGSAASAAAGGNGSAPSSGGGGGLFGGLASLAGKIAPGLFGASAMTPTVTAGIGGAMGGSSVANAAFQMPSVAAGTGADVLGGAGMTGLGDITASSAGAAASSGGLWESLLAMFADEGGFTSGSGRPGVRHFPASYFAGAPHYAEGTPNTSGGMPAVVHPNEAIIPLSRGRKVPIEFTGGMGGMGGHTINMTVNAQDADSFKMAQPQIESRMGAALQRSSMRNGN